MVHTVGLVLHPQRDSSPAIETIINWATARKVTVLGLPDEVGRIDCSAVAVDVPELVKRAALLVSLGGDGTMLRSMRLIAGRETPVLGVNLGRLGFLAEIDVDELPSALTDLGRSPCSAFPTRSAGSTAARWRSTYPSWSSGRHCWSASAATARCCAACG